MNDSDLMKSIILGSLAADEVQETGNVSEAMQEALSSVKVSEDSPEVSSNVKEDKYIGTFCRQFFEMEERGSFNVKADTSQIPSVSGLPKQNEYRVQEITKIMCPTSLSSGENEEQRRTKSYALESKTFVFSSIEALVQKVLEYCGHSSTIKPIVQRTTECVSLQFFCDNFGEQITSLSNLDSQCLLNHITINCKLC